MRELSALFQRLVKQKTFFFFVNPFEFLFFSSSVICFREFPTSGFGKLHLCNKSSLFF